MSDTPNAYKNLEHRGLHKGLGPAQESWASLAAQPWDLIVIGGGITGAGVLREAARCGLRALLIEQQDFAWGTSSRSSKMVHGGLRYLGQGDYTLTRHSLLERERLLKEAPGLVERMGYYFTLRQQKSPPAWAVKILLWLYDRIAGISDHRRIPLPALRRKFPGIATEGLKDCFYYTDAVTDDARLVMRTLQEAVDDGGTAINYARAEKLLLDSDGKVQGCSVRSSVSNECIDIKASAVVNATGAWADELRNQLTSEKRIRPLRGSHLVIAQERLPVSSAVTLMHPDDQRAMFIFPWEQRTVIGTTDLDHRAPLNQEASIDREEVNYLLKAANDLFPEAELQDEDIISTWSGVRPVIGSEKSKDPSKERRDHSVWRDGNLITVSGGKLTTFRLIALDVLHALKSVIDIPEIDTQAPVFSSSFSKSAHYPQCPAAIFEHLHARYGNRVKSLLQNAGEQDLTPIADTSITIAECRWILQHEAVAHLDDFMLRRTRLGQLLKQGGIDLLPLLKADCMRLMNWSEQCWQDEVQRYQSIWQQHYSLPTA